MNIAISARNFTFDGCPAAAMLEEAGHTVTDLSDRVFPDAGAYSDAIRDADAVINAFEPMPRALLETCGRLRLVSVRGVGYDYIDAQACRDLGVAVARTVGEVGDAVSEQALAYLFHFSRQIARQNADMQRGVWNRIMTPGLSGMTLGVVGFGEIGQALAKKAAALGMRVVYTCRTPKPALPFDFLPLDELLSVSDYVVLALPLTDGTRGMIDAGALSKMKPDAVLVNVARYGIVDAPALKAALVSGRLRGAAVDVFETEPCTDSILRGVENLILTPHTAPFTKRNFIAMNVRAAQNVIDFFAGTIEGKYLV